MHAVAFLCREVFDPEKPGDHAVDGFPIDAFPPAPRPTCLWVAIMFTPDVGQPRTENLALYLATPDGAKKLYWSFAIDTRGQRKQLWFFLQMSVDLQPGPHEFEIRHGDAVLYSFPFGVLARA
jgi:hypothetical protein